MAKLSEIIKALPVGKARSIKAPAFEAAIGNSPRGTNNDQTRRDIKDAIMRLEIPIGSSSHGGYFLIDSDQEYQEVVDRINATVRDFEEKKDAISRGWNRRKQSKQTLTPWPK